jgi:flavin-dependent dehydrogenase
MDDSLTRTSVIVVGAGPAGLATAITCARGGLGVTVITRTPGIITRVESLHPGVEPLLRSLGAINVLTACSLARYEHIERDGVLAPLSPLPNERWYGAHVDRGRFDEALLDEAIRVGVKTQFAGVCGLDEEGGRVASVMCDDGTTLRARFFVDASGRRAVLARRLRIPAHSFSHPLTAWTGSCAAPSDSSPNTRFVINGDEWSWITPALCGEQYWTRLALSSQCTLAPPPELPHAPTARRGYDVRWRLREAIVHRGVAMVGDSASVLDPATGHGVLEALYSGVQCARMLLDCARDPERQALYETLYHCWAEDRFYSRLDTLRMHYAAFSWAR